MSTASFYQELDSLLPRWMQIAPFTFVGKIMAGLAALLDAVGEGVYQGRFAAMPGQMRINGVPGIGGFDSVDALPLIGRDRSIRSGIAEAPWDFAFRLRNWLNEWTDAGTTFQLLRQLAAVLGPNAGTIRIVYASPSSGPSVTSWWTWDGTTLTYQNTNGTGFDYVPSSGVVTQNSATTNAWNWDASTSPPPYDIGDGSRFWVIVYAPLTTPQVPLPGPTYEETNDALFTSPGVVNDEWQDLTASCYGTTSVPSGSASTLSIGIVPDPAAGTVGLSAPQNWVESIRHVLSDFQCASCECAYVIVSFDPTAFNPTGDSTPTSIPNGAWGWHAAYDPTSGARLTSRFPHADYIAAAIGGIRS